MKMWLSGGTLIACALLALWLWTPDKSRAQLEARYLSSSVGMMDLVGRSLLVQEKSLVQERPLVQEKPVVQERLRVGDCGPRDDAPAVILIHGFGSSLETWDQWVDGLCVGHRVIRFDLPGSGVSWPDPTSDYSDRRSVDLLLALMDQLDLRRASIVGHSIGGRIAWTFAAAHPERVDRLVLVAPDGFASPGFEYGKAPEVPRLLGLMQYVLPKPLLRISLQPAYADPARLSDALIERYDDLIRAPGARRALLDRMRRTVLVDPRPRLATIQAPTLLIWGARDAMIPFANSADYLKALPHARLIAIAGAGHLPQEEAAAQSLEAVRAFLVP